VIVRPSVLTVVQHAPTDTVARVRDAVLQGAGDDAIDDVEVRVVEALEGGPDDVLGSGAVLLITPVNIGYMSGALKHFFDVSFRALDGATDGLPYALVVKGRSDGTGAIRAVEEIAGGLGWRRARPPLELIGDLEDADLEACRELGAMMAAGLSVGGL
jgi:NAD(P)H-dependent FMN reductase